MFTRPRSTSKCDFSTDRLYNRCTHSGIDAGKQETEQKKIASDEGICYSLMNSYIRSYYIYPIDTTIYNYNVMNGYKAKYIFIYWVDHTHESDGDININNFILERPNLKTLDIWSDDHLIKSYEEEKGETAINWDKMYQDFIEWTG